MILDFGECHISAERRSNIIVVFDAWFHAGLYVSVDSFVKGVLDMLDTELTHLHPSAILFLNVSRWLSETALGEEPRARLFFYVFTSLSWATASS